MDQFEIAICGGGVGGLACALALIKAGHKVTVFERAEQFLRIGADVNLTPNAVKALDGLGIGEALRKTAARPAYRISRTWDTGEETSRLPMSKAAEEKYGAPQLTIHRGDLLQAMEAAIDPAAIRLGRQVVSVETGGERPAVVFADGKTESFDLVIGADGIHSAVRTSLFGADAPEFTGLVSYRAVIESKDVDVPNLDCFTKWWGATPDMQVVTFPLLRGEELFIFATTSQPEWTAESWTMPGDVEELRAIYAGFHPEVQQILAACTSVTKSALYVRQPFTNWSRGGVTILGDAAHPMVPFMAQGACMAIEDAIVLTRSLQGASLAEIPLRLNVYEQLRKPRTSQVQEGSRANNWLKGQGNADWVYSYDAWGLAIPAA
ncbi:MAG: FAD-dependent monooxygenase [Pelagibacterium sp.]|uniref:FAD-dependent monooxygenase n=1 Tax=Pelagibacterium sp. TaxID=1967288 RepID=UPI0032ED7AD2